MKQAQALHSMRRGDSVFLTGPAGSGKTYVLNQFIAYAKARKKNVAITASTGIAATHIGGMTIHSWSGLGIRDSLSEQDKAWLLNNDRLAKRYNATDVLIIDEVSMLHGKRLDMVNEACRLLRGNEKPFGGMQVILTGDLFQLPPISREAGNDDFVHLSNAWLELDPKICYITEQHRQQADGLLEVLRAMRAGRLGPEQQATLQGRIGVEPEPGVTVTRLYTHNVDVEAINERQLLMLPEEPEVYTMLAAGNARYVEQLKKSVLAPPELELKRGAEVMFVANNFSQGFANGSRGRVVDFKGDTPIVQLQSSRRKIAVEPHAWVLNEDGKERARVTQLPLRLAWAITIHKSQGMSLDGALIDLTRSFTYGMGYVALSRVRSLDGLYLTGLNDLALRLHPAIFTFDAQLRRSSEALEAALGDIEENPDDPHDEQLQEAELQDRTPLEQDHELFEQLRRWRVERAAAQHVPAYVVANNSALEAIAVRKPRTTQELLAIPGVGKKFIDKYGAEVLELVRGALGIDADSAELQTIQTDGHVMGIVAYLEENGVQLSEAKRQALKQLLQDTD